MTAATASALTLTGDELRALAHRSGVGQFPTVLDVRSGHGTIADDERALGEAAERLVARGILSAAGDPADDPAGMVRVLQRPAREFAVRLVTPDGTARICVVPSGPDVVVARRIGDTMALRRGGRGLSGAVRAVLAELPAAAPVEVDAFGAPTRQLADSLACPSDAALIADRLRALGASHQVAATLGAALGSRAAFAEIVHHRLDAATDRITRVPAAVAVFYTRRGRLVSAPSTSPSGQLWTTLKPGSDHRIAQAVSQLADLAPGGWEGDAQYQQR